MYICIYIYGGRPSAPPPTTTPRVSCGVRGAWEIRVIVFKVSQCFRCVVESVLLLEERSTPELP